MHLVASLCPKGIWQRSGHRGRGSSAPRGLIFCSKWSYCAFRFLFFLGTRNLSRGRKASARSQVKSSSKSLERRGWVVIRFREIKLSVSVLRLNRSTQRKAVVFRPGVTLPILPEGSRFKTRRVNSFRTVCRDTSEKRMYPPVERPTLSPKGTAHLAVCCAPSSLGSFTFASST